MPRTDTATKPSLVSRIGALAETGTDFRSAPDEARATLHSLRQEYPEFRKALEQRFARLPATHQQAVLALFEAAPAPDMAPLLQQWSHSPALPLCTRAQALALQECTNAPIDATYRDTLTHAVRLLHQLSTPEPSPLAEDGTLVPPWPEDLGQLPVGLTLDVASELAGEHPERALAVLRAVRPAAEESAAPALVDVLANVPLADSAALLQEMFAESTDKGLHKAIKKALHRLKVQGVAVAEMQPQGHTAVVGAVAHRLEKCLASFIDGAGDRMLLLIRTKPMGGYNMAYLVINYGTGIRYALGLQATRRELPEILEKVQGPAPLIELEPTYCQYQIALAHQMNLETHTPVPEEYFTLQDIIGECNTTFERAIIYSALTDADLQAAKTYDTYANDLLELSEFAGWTLPASIIQKYGDALREIEQSQIVVSPTMQQERINEIQARAMEEVLGERSRRIMRLRLEEMAYYLLRTDRRREALWAVAAAQSLEDDNPTRLRRNPFAGALLERSLELAKARPSSGRIILPFSNLPGGGGSSEPRLII
jgi:hypothetical protein